MKDGRPQSCLHASRHSEVKSEELFSSDGEQRYRVQGTCWKLCKKSVAGYGTEPASLKSMCQHSSHLKFNVFSARYQRIKF